MPKMPAQRLFGKFHELADASPNALWVTEGDEIVYVNAACLRVLSAKNAEDVLGLSPSALIADGHEEQDWEACVREAGALPSEPHERKLLRLDGTIVEVEISLAILPMAEGPKVIRAMLRDITARNHGRRRIEQLQSALVSGLIDAQEEERRTIAYDIHDGLTQYVMAASAHLQAGMAAWDEGDESRAREQFATLQSYLNQAGLESRRLVSGLRCLVIEDLGLAGAVEQLLADDRERTRWKSATLAHNLTSERLEPRIETAAFRIVQEALNNVRKHARASRVEVSLRVWPDGGCLELEVRDDGVGMESTPTEDDIAHVGLHGMTERVRQLGGSFTATTRPEGGMKIAATIPLVRGVKIK